MRHASRKTPRRGLGGLAALLLAGSGCFASYSLHERAVAHNRAGIDRLAAGDLEGAAAAFRLALEYNGRFSEPYNNLALVAIRNDDLDEAERLLRAALRLNPDFAEAWTNLGFVHLRRGEPAEAVDTLLEAIRIDPGQDDARYDLVLALAEAGRLDEAWEQVLRLDVASPDDPAAQGLVAWIGARLGRCAEALGRATQALAVRPGEGLANLAAGTCLLAERRPAEAEPFLRAAVRAETGSAGWLSLGLALLQLERWGEARAAFAQARDERPGLTPALVGEGTAAAALGERDAARALLEQALRLDAEAGGAALPAEQRDAASRLLQALAAVDSPTGAE